MIELSVVIATYNRADRLRACLDALAMQTEPALHFEVVVVIDGSTDGTREMLEHYAASYLLRWIWQANSGQCTALNRGVAAAQGRICLLLDDDIIASPQLIAEHVRLHRQQNDVIGIGHLTISVPPDADWFAKGFAQLWHGHYDRLNYGDRQAVWKDCYSGNLSVARTAFESVGGFVTDLARSYDIELGYRLVQVGQRVVYLQSAVGHQDERKTYRELGSDAIKAGTAAVELYHRYPSTLPVLLGWFGNTSIRAVMLRRLLLWLNISPTLLIRVGGLARHRPGVYKLFRFLHAYCFWTGVRRALPSSGWRRLSSGTAILMYHAFGDEHEEASRYVVPVKLFRLHMAVLWWLRYRVLSLEDYVDYRQSCALPPARSVVITIDDGYADNVTLAAPVLRRYGFPATFFLVSRAIGTKNSWDQDGALARRPLVSTDAARSLNEAPLGVGAHTQSHPALTALTEAEQAQEISRSRSDLEQLVGKRITVFSYPYGKHNETTKRLVAQAGFEAACAVTPGLTWLNTPLYGLHRIEIFGSDHILRFIYKLITGAKCIKSPAIAWYRRLKELQHDS